VRRGIAHKLRHRRVEKKEDEEAWKEPHPGAVALSLKEPTRETRVRGVCTRCEEMLLGNATKGGRAAEQQPYAAAVVAIAAPRDSLANQIAGKRRKEPG
jgi:hypothetical protein